MSSFTTVVSPQDLRAHLERPDWVVIDCRFTLADPPAGLRAHKQSHIPGAGYAHLDEDLSGPVIKGKTGRHPLPAVSELARKLGAWGVDANSQVAVYDASNGSMAARLWWLLQWLGHERVAVLDGGWPGWTAAGYPTSSAVASPRPRTFVPHPNTEMALDAGAVDRVRTDPHWRVLDARAADRFRGENETIDPVAGHVPGAVSVPWAENVTPEGRFKSPGELRARFSAVMKALPADRVVCYCGSGVTAAHDVLAIAHAGLGLAKLYPGSWSEWITDPSRPTGKGP